MISMNMSSNIINDGVWIGEDGIIAAAMFLSREIYVFMAVDRISPIVYPKVKTEWNSASIKVAFYEPGHHRAVCDELPTISTNNVLN